MLRKNVTVASSGIGNTFYYIPAFKITAYSCYVVKYEKWGYVSVCKTI